MTVRREKDLTTNGVIAAINSLVGAATPQDAASQMQTDVVVHIQKAVDRFGRPPSHLSGKQALRELCSSTPTYCGSSSRVAYCEELISWPPEGSVAVDALEVLSGEAHRLLTQWESDLLRSTSSAARARDETGIRQPYSDPALVRSGRKYGRFLQALARRGMLQFKKEGPTTLRVFFVR